MRRTLMAIIVSAVVAGGICLAHHDEHGKGGENVKVLSQKAIAEKIGGKKARATTVEVTLVPGEVEAAHRHPGPAFGYILEGE
jgi:quercetin dioxygenase-like cupin family protein